MKLGIRKKWDMFRGDRDDNEREYIIYRKQDTCVYVWNFSKIKFY